MKKDDVGSSFQNSVSKEKKQTRKKDHDSYFEGHICMVPSIRKKKINVVHNAFVKFMHKLTTVDTGDTRARYLFKYEIIRLSTFMHT